MKIILKLLAGIIFLPYISFIIIFFIFNYFFDKEKQEDVKESSVEFIDANLNMLLILNIAIWVYIISKIY